MSPQCHCRHDDLFDTSKPSAGNLQPSSHWQEKAGFVDNDDPRLRDADDLELKKGHQPDVANEEEPNPAKGIAEAKESEGVPDEQSAVRALEDVEDSATVRTVTARHEPAPVNDHTHTPDLVDW